ncbi:DUF736 domain-containing protein [Inquilinus limosus]|uniref:DUF736 domain-containing protein n=1 Tax=Inquilinus limosus TaxID=171674 RepID=A0A211ZUW5_9PROT|nr:DUF736 family protein [Inquilinus limosus]OWJ68956.1 hypothetical protein BWR60_01780 [Inquilinus limosus]
MDLRAAPAGPQALPDRFYPRRLRESSCPLTPGLDRPPTNQAKSGDTQPDFRALTQDVEIGAGWTRTGEASGKTYVSLSLAAPEFGPRKLYANLGRAAGQDDPDVFALIWNPIG